MRIIFCGTPEYAVPSLKKLAGLAPRHSTVAVVSQPDRPKGRSRAPSPPPVVETARALGIPDHCIFQPKSINRPETIQALKALTPDVLCVIAYGNLLKADALALPRIVALNAHASLLPKYRGASPIQAALLNGDMETGVSIIKMELGLDTGGVMFSRNLAIAPIDDAGTLHDKLASLSAECFVEALNKLDSGQYEFVPQDENRTSRVSKLDKNSGKVDWTQDAAFIERFVRAMNPWPGAWTRVALAENGPTQRLRVVRVEIRGDIAGNEVRDADGNACFRIKCGQGSLLILEVQPEGKRVMSTAEFLRGSGRAFAGQKLIFGG